MSMLTNVLVGAHIGSGAFALICGLGAALSDKRRTAHRRWGQGYVTAMFGVVATAIPVTFLRPNPFLSLVALFAFQLTFAGWRAAKLKANLTRWPMLARGGRVVDALSIAWSVGFMGYGGYRLLGAQDSFGTVAIIFGVIGLRLALKELRRADERPAAWILHHLLMMGAALISTVTAVLVVNANRLLPGVPPTLIWLLPTFIGTPLIAYVSARWKTRLKLA
jgi:hypothetical protein